MVGHARANAELTVKGQQRCAEVTDKLSRTVKQILGVGPPTVVGVPEREPPVLRLMPAGTPEMFPHVNPGLPPFTVSETAFPLL